jgi:predicted transcriptional regulator
MNRKKKNIPPKSLEQLLEETKTKKETLLKILEKITKENPESQTPN